jgi:hypothetical protein
LVQALRIFLKQLLDHWFCPHGANTYKKLPLIDFNNNRQKIAYFLQAFEKFLCRKSCGFYSG